ncbi:phospholipid carrier-dependent glycosyltransferase [Candidatus Poribacteria bacterium]|nr:phospholipid carrier-dependent glycosyltransferase [Candidatus Poribacteria bacterium]MYA56074.1 phospholipid carrier-dependent glycosyltransferase [Candidatus Poribacteria bacterium]
MRKFVIISVFLLFLVLLTFLPRLSSLSAHWASDEFLWMERSREFLSAMKTQQFRKTYITYHPGVTTCWLGSMAIWYRSQRDGLSESWLNHNHSFLTPEILASIRFPVGVVTGILILLAGILIYRLFGRTTACLGTLFLAVEPFLLAESRRAHTDALTSLFLFLALLLWLCYLKNERFRRSDLVLSGISFGLACLSKSVACAFLLFLPLLLGWYIIYRNVPWAKMVCSALLWMMSALMTVTVVWPYMWTTTFKLWNIPVFPILFIGCGANLVWCSRKLSSDTDSMLTRVELLILAYGLFMTVGVLVSSIPHIMDAMHWAVTEANAVPTLFLGEIRYNPGILYFPVMWLVWSTPLTFPLIGFAIYRVWQQRNSRQQMFSVVVVLGLFVLFYLVGLTIASKKISRYIVVFLPVVSLLTTLGAIEAVALFKKKQWKLILIAALLMLQIAPILRLHPYYRTYYYPLLSGKWIAMNTSSITGAGLSLAADYLNSLPNASQLRVRLSPFSGDMVSYLIKDTSLQESNTNASNTFDYEVEYLYDRQILGPPVDPPPKNADQEDEWQPTEEDARELEHVVRLNDIDYVWIYRLCAKEHTDNAP